MRFHFLVVMFCLMVLPLTSFGQIASSAVHGVGPTGTLIPISVEADGRMKINKVSAFTDGAADAQGLVDADGSVQVAIKKDIRFTATKTTSNTVANATSQTVTPIANQKRVVLINNDQRSGKQVWVKVGANDAGLDSGFPITSYCIVDDCDETTVISYWASETTKLAIVQE